MSTMVILSIKENSLGSVIIMDAILGVISIIGAILSIGTTIYFVFKKNAKWKLSILGIAFSAFLLVIAVNMDSGKKPTTNQTSPAVSTQDQRKNEAANAVSVLYPYQKTSAALINRYKQDIGKISRGEMSPVTGYQELDEIENLSSELSAKITAIEVPERYQECQDSILTVTASIAAAAKNSKKQLDNNKVSNLSEAREDYKLAASTYLDVRTKILDLAAQDGYTVPPELTPPGAKNKTQQ